MSNSLTEDYMLTIYRTANWKVGDHTSTYLYITIAFRFKRWRVNVKPKRVNWCSESCVTCMVYSFLRFLSYFEKSARWWMIFSLMFKSLHKQNICCDEIFEMSIFNKSELLLKYDSFYELKKCTKNENDLICYLWFC